MDCRDLGDLTGDVLVFGGPYSNLQATSALIAEAARRGVAPGNCICTGDVVAYCADPAATVAEIRAFGCAVVAGNCERQLAQDAPDCGCGFDPGSTCDALSAGWYAHASAQVGTGDRAWMRSLPDIVTFRHLGRRVAVIHGGVTDISLFLWPDAPVAAFQTELAALTRHAGPVDLVLAGHCGVAFARVLGDVTWVNAGAIGMPPHDGRPQTRFVILGETGAMIHRLSYPADQAAAAMRRSGLTQGYHQALTTGIWPSEDVLPCSLRR
jgi:predicted phosphodiesterase